MTGNNNSVIAGVDTHKDTHYAAVITQTGQHLEAAQFPTTPAGYRALTAFITSFGPLAQVGVEGTSSYGAGLARHLRGQGIGVVEVLRPGKPASRRGRGKSDEIDAYAAAETALAGVACSTPKTGDGPVQAIRATLTARRSAVKASTEATGQIRDLLICGPDQIRTQYRGKQGKTLITALAKSRPGSTSGDNIVEASTRRALHMLARRVRTLQAEIAEHDQDLADLVTEVNPSLLQAKGIGPVSAGDLLLAAGDNPERITSEASFAALCGAAPVPASSGKTNKFRLNRGGNRQANSALHRIAVVRLHTDPRTRSYAERRRGEGKTTKEILRCLKRAIVREVYHLITDPPEPLDTRRLRPARESLGLTLDQAATALDCSIAALSIMERGRSSNRDAITTYTTYLDTLLDAA